MTTDPRKPREIQSRSKAARDTWVPPSVLPDPVPHPDYVYRWVRVDTMGVNDNRNVSLRMREGWEPCPAQDHPEIVASLMPNSIRSETMSQNQDVELKGNIVIGGLMLCRMPKGMAAQRQAYYANLATRQLEGVDNTILRELSPTMPVFNESKSRRKVGKNAAIDD